MLELSTITYGNPRHPPLIFLHGFLGCKEDWEGMLPFFQERFYCIAIDLPGHGQSPPSQEMLATIKEAIWPLASKPFVIGYSMGGRIALQLQDQFSALAILSAHPGLATQKEKDDRRKIDEEWCEKLLKLPFDAFLGQWYAQPIFQSLSHKPDLLQAILKKRMQQDPHNLAHILRQMSLSNQPQISDFPSPTLFLYGEEDLKYRQLYYKLPNIAVRCVKGSGHTVHLENAAACAEQIINWIEVTNANT
jgi:2-succinyl-6-hydroxy-2,4-cyclohexadiene-1-carboxylate synthase